MRDLLRERDESVVNRLLIESHHRNSKFKWLLSQFDSLLDEEKRERENPENEELVRDLRNLYSLLNKHLLETVLQPEGGEINLYRFVLEDRSSRKVKYIAVGPL
jgi:hypothetical protein